MSEDAFLPFLFLHFGDPQMGVGPGGIPDDERRFLQAVGIANAVEPEFVFVAGDLVNDRTPEEYAALGRVLDRLRPPAKLVPGNHDIINADDIDGLKNYRERFGEDYSQFTVHNCDFLCLNTLTLPTEKATTPQAQEESERQWRWLKESLQDSQEKDRAHIVVLTHVPPFIHTEDEPDEYFNLPQESRRRLLSLLREFGVRHILAGHTHTTRVVESGGITVYTVGGTSLLLDKCGHGYRAFRVYADRIEQTYYPLDGPPPEPMR